MYDGYYYYQGKKIQVFGLYLIITTNVSYYVSSLLKGKQHFIMNIFMYRVAPYFTLFNG